MHRITVTRHALRQEIATTKCTTKNALIDAKVCGRQYGKVGAIRVLGAFDLILPMDTPPFTIQRLIIAIRIEKVMFRLIH